MAPDTQTQTVKSEEIARVYKALRKRFLARGDCNANSINGGQDLLHLEAESFTNTHISPKCQQHSSCINQLIGSKIQASGFNWYCMIDNIEKSKFIIISLDTIPFIEKLTDEIKTWMN